MKIVKGLAIPGGCTLTTFLMVVVIVSTSTVVMGQEGRHLEFIRLIDSILPEVADIDSLSDHFLQTMFKMMSTQSVFLKTVERLHDRVSGWRNSSELAEWYYSRSFDYIFTRSWKSLIPINFYTDWECLTVVKLNLQQVHNCLDSMVGGLDRVRNIPSPTIGDKELKGKLCRYTFQNCGRSSSTWLQTCSPAVKQTLNVFMNVLAGYDCNVNVIEPSTAKPGGDSNRTLLNQALSYCATHFLPHTDLTMLFPPSEASLSYIHRGHSVRDQKRLMAEFCKIGPEYSKCVTDNLRKTGLWEDMEVRKYIDVDNFDDVVTEFCQQQSLISSQFECTLDSLTNRPCYGGMNDIMEMYSETMLSNLSFNRICRKIQSALECRIQDQLSRCEARYARLMEKLYQGLLSDDCKHGRLQLDILPCLFEYIDSLRTRYTDLNDPELLYNELDLVCSKYKDRIIACIEAKVNDLDTFNITDDDVNINADTIKWNIKTMVEYACSSLKSIQPDLACATKSLQQSTGAASCKDGFINTFWTTIYTFDDPKESKPLCRALHEMWDCYQAALRDCNSRLLTVLTTVADSSVELCSHPNSPISLPVSRASRLSLTLRYITVSVALVLSSMCRG